MSDEPGKETHIETEGGAYVAGPVETGGDFVGRDKIVTNIFQTIVRRPQDWRMLVWKSLKRHRLAFAAIVALEIALAALYILYRDLYRISPWLWAASALMLAGMLWSLLQRRPARRPKQGLLAGALLAFGFIAFTGWQAWQIAFPPAFDSQPFSIALAELGEGAAYRRTGRTRELSGQINELLCAEIVGSEAVHRAGWCFPPTENSSEGAVEIRQVGVVSNPEMALAFGRRIQADILIWGQLLTTGAGNATIRFQWIEIPDRAVQPDAPLVLPVATRDKRLFSLELDLTNEPTGVKVAVARQLELISSFARGLALYYQNDYRAARPHFERAARTLSGSSATLVSSEGASLVYFYLGRVQQALGRVETGQESLLTAQQFAPGQPAIPLSLALGSFSLGQKEQGQSYLAQSLSMLTEWLKLNPEDTAARYDRGVVYQIEGRLRDALFDFREVLVRDPSFYIAYLSLSQVARDLGGAYTAEAEQALSTAVEQAQQSGTNPSWAHLHLGLLYEKTGQVKLAREAYRQACRDDPGVASLYFVYAQFLEKQGEMDAALAAYQQVVKISRDPAWAHGTLAAFLFRRGLYAEALEAYQLAVHEDPEDALLHAGLAETYSLLGQPEEARQEYEEALRRGPQVVYIAAKYAEFLYGMGEYDQAASRYEQVLGMAPYDSAMMLNLGSTYQALDDLEAARRIYNQMLDGTHDLPEAHLQIARERLAALAPAGP